MKNIKASIFAMALATSSCSAPETKAPVPAQTPQVQVPQNRPVTAPPRPAFVQPTGDWIDWPITQGDWVYRQDSRGSIALFGANGQDALLTLRCVQSDKKLYLSRAGTPQNGAKMTVRTSHTRKTYDASSTGGNPDYAAMMIEPTDGILDALAYTRGRFAVEVTGMQSVAIPSWSEIVRVAQDCR